MLRNFSRADIASLKSAASKAGYKIVDWHQFGQPPEPEGLRVIIQGGNDGLGRFVDRLAGNNSVNGLRILIRGIPFPDIFEVHADLRNRAGL